LVNPLVDELFIVFLWRSLLAYTWIKLTISPVLSGFQPPNSKKCSYSHPLHICDSNHTHPLTSWQ